MEAVEEAAATEAGIAKYWPLIAQGVMLVFYGSLLWFTTAQHTTDIAQLELDLHQSSEKIWQEHNDDLKDVRFDVSNLRARVAELGGMMTCKTQELPR